ncbi:MAG: DUF3592 domain-containing protein [Rhodospirillaceae bacterium]|nr:DUF3592 domain-containing protein [Rhodospirillales bacterium]
MADYLLADEAITAVLGAGTVTVLAALGLWTAMAEGRRSADSHLWRSVQGWVLTSRVAFDGTDAEMARAAITYEYQLGDDVYEGFVVNFGSESYLLPRQAAALVRRHPVGSAVRVWYDPANPSDSVLYRRRRTMKLWLVSGLLILWAASLWKDALPLVMP